MAISSISSADEIFYPLGMDEGYSQIEQLAERTHSIWRDVWNWVYDVTIGNLIKIVHNVRIEIGAVVRDAFFFPMKWSLIANSQAARQQLEIEESYYRDFWDPSKPLDPNLKNHERIRQEFSSPKDHIFPIQLQDGKTVEITCRVVETKRMDEKPYNFVQVPGITTTNSNNIGTTHPYLSGLLDIAERDGNPVPPARFIMVSENNLNYKPTSLDEAGFIMLETLKALKAEFGEIDELVAHSLGTIFLANALKQTSDPAVLPQHICFDRGPTSIWEVSKKYFWGLGLPLIYPLAKCTGWASDIEEDIVSFCNRWKQRPSLLVSGVVQDHHFSGKANLCFGEKIKKIKDIDILVFDPPLQLVHQSAHHNLRPDFFNARYLVGKSEFLGSLENLPEAIIRHSLNRIEEYEQTA